MRDCWIDPNGRMHEVPNCGHNEFASKMIEEEMGYWEAHEYLTDKLSNAALNRNTEYLIEAGKQYRYKKGESGRKFCSEQEKIEIRKRLDKFKFRKK